MSEYSSSSTNQCDDPVDKQARDMKRYFIK